MKPQVIIIDGPRQIGKTHLINEVVHRLRAAGLKCHCEMSVMPMVPQPEEREVTERAIVHAMPNYVLQLEQLTKALHATEDNDVVFVHQGFHSFIVNAHHQGLGDVNKLRFREVFRSTLDLFTSSVNISYFTLITSGYTTISEEDRRLWLENSRWCPLTINFTDSRTAPEFAEEIIQNRKV